MACRGFQIFTLTKNLYISNIPATMRASSVFTKPLVTVSKAYEDNVSKNSPTWLPICTHQSMVTQSSIRHFSSAVNDDTVSALPDPLEMQDGVMSNINKQITEASHGRLFAVIHIAGKQFKVTSEDLILILANKHFADVGERIVLNKVLLVAGKDFTMVGRPLLHNVRVEATVIEKTLSHPKIWFKYARRKNWRYTALLQDFRTILRINSIEVESEVD
ncbi:large ribosomal subunit protein bL21m-like [Watersipora subatra]|uniref:large ribosomal subunit protein bL21m-like n=1 Tax=Watersipora subatra TaxID=2589382 RepID=UPI00355AD3E1